MDNECVFSPDRKYRYVLKHRFDDLFSGEERLLMCIGLNPSTADEQQLDPTLRRVRGFALREGFTGFWMANLFAFRQTSPALMKREPAPVGPDNDRWLTRGAQACPLVLAAWGDHGDFLNRDAAVLELLRTAGAKVVCLKTTQRGLPSHPLYVRADQPLQPYPASKR